MELKGKVAIISGAGRGLGRAVAEAMAEAGASLVLFGRTQEDLEETVKSCRGYAGEVIMEVADAAREEETAKVVERAVSALGGIDILVNNAATLGPIKPLWEVGEDEWRDAIAVNLDGPVRLLRQVIPTMKKQLRGKVINVTSGLAEMVQPRMGVYSVSKAALNHFTRIAAAELIDYNIQVNGLDPGVMDTGMQEEIRSHGPSGLGDSLYRQFLFLKEKGKLKAPREVADLALFLASPRSDRVSGFIGSAEDYAGQGYRHI